tara:strand:- start:350 stop:943 length:594 start_codon:yes stop_codon:yes gene_type:complete
MARIIDVVDASLRSWYTPDIDDNRQDPDPFQVLISPLSGKDMRQLRSSLKLKATSLDNDDLMQAAERREEELKALIVEKHVHDVRGFSAKHIGTGEVIVPKSGHELVKCILEAHPDELIVLHDIYEAVLRSSSLTDEAKKKLSLQSDLPPPVTPEDNPGDALNVEGLALQTRTTSGDNGIATAVPISAASVSTGHLT